jgi:hypothetical protein
VKHALPLAALGILLASAASAGAGFTPAWSYVPAPLRAQLAQKSGGSLYLPARTPSFYRYRSGATVVNGKLTVPFSNRVRVSAGVWRWTKQTFLWHTAPFAGDCASWDALDKTLQLSGNKVYSSSTTGTVWRCVRDRRGRQIVLSATAPTPGRLGPGVAVASALDVSGRTSSITVALTVKPKTVHRGGTILVSGVAGGCTSGDTVTMISHAFPSTHSFAGVPAVFATVGSAGRFSATTRIPVSRATGSYAITARCGGGNLGVTAHLAVT